MKIGSKARVRMGATGTVKTGTIVYVHPKRRFCVEDVELPFGKHVRETVYPIYRRSKIKS